MPLLPPSGARTTPSASSLHEAWSPPPLLLETACGDDDLIAELILTFSTDTAARIRRSREAFAACYFSRIRMEAHTIKGGARQVGADAVAEACQELETVARLQEAFLVAARLDRVQEVFEEIGGEMASYSSRRSAEPATTPSI